MSATSTKKFPLSLATNLASTLLAPLQLSLCAIHPRLRLPIRERLGRPTLEPSKHRPTLLFHAASAGDVRAVVPVIRALSDDFHIHLTVQTRSGRSTAEGLLTDDLCTFSALPIEAWPAHETLLAALNPRAIILEYLELWPGLLRAAKHRGCPVLLMNARLHPERERAYARPWFRERLRALHVISARSEDDAQRLARLGHPDVPAMLHTKHALLSKPSPDAVKAVRQRHHITSERSRTWIAGSVHIDERHAVMHAAARLRDAGGGHLVLVPRYPTQARVFAREAHRLGLRVHRSDGSAAAPSPGAHVTLIETVGELSALYGVASAAFIGGTLGKRGGQNPFEAAVAGCSVVNGAHIEQIRGELEVIPHHTLRDANALHEVIAAALAAPESPHPSGMHLAEEAKASVDHVCEAIREVVFSDDTTVSRSARGVVVSGRD